MKSFFPGVFRYIGELILRFLYGADFQRRWYTEPFSGVKKVETVLSVCTILWFCVLAYLLIGNIEPGTLHCVVYIVAYPVILAAWFVIARHRAK